MKKIGKILVTLLVAIMVLSFVSAPAEAKATKKVNASKTWEKAAALQVGKNVVKDKYNKGYISFKAPSTGKYTFTFSDVSHLTKPATTGLGNVSIWEARKSGSASYLGLKGVSTEGGKSEFLRMASKNYKYNPGGEGVNKYLKTRNAKKVKLKKGQRIYFCFYFTGGQSKYNVIVKKVK